MGITGAKLPLALAATAVLALAGVVTLSWGPGPASLAQDGISGVFRSSMDHETASAEGAMYVHALERAGLKVTPKQQKVIDMSLSAGLRKASSLAISTRLQKDVALASEMKDMTQ